MSHRVWEDFSHTVLDFSKYIFLVSIIVDSGELFAIAISKQEENIKVNQNPPSQTQDEPNINNSRFNPVFVFSAKIWV